MKLEPPVPVPVDSILSWGCDDDLLSNKFNSCDVADSTTGGHLDAVHLVRAPPYLDCFCFFHRPFEYCVSST